MEETMSTLVFVGIGCLLAGAAIGYFLANKKPEQQSRAALEKQFTDMQQQQQEYQQQVSSHFDRTAELLNDLAESYRSVHNHIAEGASSLHSTGISPLQAIPEGRPVLEGPSHPRGASNTTESVGDQDSRECCRHGDECLAGQCPCPNTR